MQRLRESTGSKAGRGCLVLFALVWTAFSLFWTWSAWRSGAGLMTLFGVPFIAIGLALMLAVFWRSIAAARVGRPELTVTKDALRPGEGVFARYQQTFRFPVDVIECKVELVFRETAVYRQGTDTHTEVHERVIDFFEAPVGHFGAGERTQSEGQLTIPADAMHTFTAANNKLQWFLRVVINAQQWPDLEEEFELQVLAEGV